MKLSEFIEELQVALTLQGDGDVKVSGEGHWNSTPEAYKDTAEGIWYIE